MRFFNENELEPNEQKSEWQIWAPFLLYLLLAMWSWIGLFVAMAWIVIGVLLLTVTQWKLTSYGRPKYLHGFLKIILGIYHAFWWPIRLWEMFRYPPSFY